ncbi:MAG TPA: hypothetical protein VGD67_20085 [Pseudonocardiaceae bacterium]
MTNNRRFAATGAVLAAVAAAALLATPSAVAGPGGTTDVGTAAQVQLTCGDNIYYTGTPPWQRTTLEYLNCASTPVNRRAVRSDGYAYPYCITIPAGQSNVMGSLNPTYYRWYGTVAC